MSILDVTSVSKTFKRVDGPVRVLSDLSLGVELGTALCLSGANGSGKSTLLYLMGGFLDPDDRRGAVLWGTGVPIHAMSERRRAALRNRLIGFVPQSPHLIAELTVLDNVALPLVFRGEGWEPARRQAHAVLLRTGLDEDVFTSPPGCLSGGMKKRAAIARALVGEPRILLADEPEASLDVEREQLMDLLFERVWSGEAAMVFSTHDETLKRRATRQVVLTPPIALAA